MTGVQTCALPISSPTPPRTLQHVTGDGFQAETDGPPVQGLQRQNFQEKQIEGALYEVVRFTHIGFLDEHTRYFSR